MWPRPLGAGLAECGSTSTCHNPCGSEAARPGPQYRTIEKRQFVGDVVAGLLVGGIPHNRPPFDATEAVVIGSGGSGPGHQGRSRAATRGAARRWTATRAAPSPSCSRGWWPHADGRSSPRHTHGGPRWRPRWCLGASRHRPRLAGPERTGTIPVFGYDLGPSTHTRKEVAQAAGVDHGEPGAVTSNRYRGAGRGSVEQILESGSGVRNLVVLHGARHGAHDINPHVHRVHRRSGRCGGRPPSPRPRGSGSLAHLPSRTKGCEAIRVGGRRVWALRLGRSAPRVRGIDGECGGPAGTGIGGSGRPVRVATGTTVLSTKLATYSA